MKLVLAGEGKSDMGQVEPGANGMEFVPGPMACIVDKLIETRVDYSLLDLQETGGESIRFVSETELASYGKSGPRLLSGLKYGKGNAFFTRNAQVLGLLAKQERAESKCPVVAVLFRDTDSTASASHDL